MLNSYYQKLCGVNLPYSGRQKYMHTFDLANPIMADGFEDYLEPVIRLCRAARAYIGLAHMTVDEKIVERGFSQRRPKPHVDGCFVVSENKWSHGGGGWFHGPAFKRMPVIVVSSEVGCRAWSGQFEGEPKDDGDLSHLELGDGEILPPNIGYLLSADCVHESMIQSVDIKRTFLRIALPNTFTPAAELTGSNDK